MANTFKNKGVAVTDSATTIYTTPSSTTSVVHAVYISNIHFLKETFFLYNKHFISSYHLHFGIKIICFIKEYLYILDHS